jgi:hypothetical protein
VCSHEAIPVCLNPAYTIYLSATANGLAPLLSQLAGLPGAPARIVQEATVYRQEAGNGIGVGVDPLSQAGSSTARVFRLILPVQLLGPNLTASQLADQVVTTYGPQIVARVIGEGPGASQAQNAVATALMMAAGLRGLDGYQRFSRSSGPAAEQPGAPGVGQSSGVAPGTPAYAAAKRFAAWPAAARHAWLTAHLSALRAGRVTLAQLP